MKPNPLFVKINNLFRGKSSPKVLTFTYNLKITPMGENWSKLVTLIGKENNINQPLINSGLQIGKLFFNGIYF
jgi:hypothetical protein